MWHAQAMANRRRRSNDGADEIAQAIHRIVDAMQPIAAQPRAVVAPTHHVTMEDFMRYKPSKFTGKSILDEADAWLKECEKICRVIECTDAQKLTFITFLLVADVEYWWASMQQLMQTREKQVTWTSFRKKFLEKYFPNSVRHEREAEFLTLRKGNITVQAYTDKFEYLARFYSPTVIEEWRCRKWGRAETRAARIHCTPPDQGVSSLDGAGQGRWAAGDGVQQSGSTSEEHHWFTATEEAVWQTSGGIVQNPQAARVMVVALESAMFVIRRGISHVTTLTRNQLKVRQQRSQLGSDLEHRVVCSPWRLPRQPSQVI